MNSPEDAITVGEITINYRSGKGWDLGMNKFTMNPIKAQYEAERLNNFVSALESENYE